MQGRARRAGSPCGWRLCGSGGRGRAVVVGKQMRGTRAVLSPSPGDGRAAWALGGHSGRAAALSARSCGRRCPGSASATAGGERRFRAGAPGVRRAGVLRQTWHGAMPAGRIERNPASAGRAVLASSRFQVFLCSDEFVAAAVTNR